MNHSLSFYAACLLSVGCLIRPATAATIHWGNAIGDNLVSSTGTPWVASDNLKIQLGTFPVGFLPTTANISQWASQWRVLDTAALNPAARYFSSSFFLMANGASSSPRATLGATWAESEPVYLMIFNNTANDETTQLFLGRAQDWALPAPGGTQADKPVNFRVEQIATTPLYGATNNQGGDGVFSPAPGSAVQTASFTPPVPEPASWILLGLGAASALRRRRRRIVSTGPLGRA